VQELHYFDTKMGKKDIFYVHAVLRLILLLLLFRMLQCLVYILIVNNARPIHFLCIFLPKNCQELQKSLDFLFKFIKRILTLEKE